MEDVFLFVDSTNEVNSTVLFKENDILAAESKTTTIIVGISIHHLFKGFRSAIIKSMPHEKAIADVSPFGYTISDNPILSAENTKVVP